MKPAVIEETEAASTRELFVQQWNENGVAIDPEKILVPMPPKCACKIELASDDPQRWYAGWDFVFKGKSEAMPCTRRTHFWKDRIAALKGALLLAAQFFQGDKKAVAALEAFHEKLTGQAPARPEQNQAEAPAAADVAKRGQFREILVSAVRPNPENHRKTFNPETEKELAASIVQNGLLQPIAVRLLDPDEAAPGEFKEIAAAAPPERFEIILGERRWRAHKRVNMDKILAMVYTGMSRRDAKIFALVENLQRDNVNPVEEAEGFADLVKEGLGQEEIAKQVGCSRSAVANALRVLELPEKALLLIREGKLSMDHGVALMRFKEWPKTLVVIATAAARDGVSARDLKGEIPEGIVDELFDEALIVSIHPSHMPAALKKHPAYFKGGWNWLCFEPAHWEAEQKRIAEEKRQAEEKARLDAEAEAAKAAKKKKLNLRDLQYGTYERLDDSRLKEVKGLSKLIPEDKRALAKDGGKEVPICTDKRFVDKLRQAAERVMKADRKEKLPALVERCRNTIKALKRVGPREIAWLLAATLDSASYGQDYIRHEGQFQQDAIKRQGVKLPSSVVEGLDEWASCQGLGALENIDQAAAVRVLLDTQLEAMAGDVEEHGGDGPAGDFLRWLLECDSLGFLEETDDGKKEIVERVKNAPWYKRDTDEPASDEKEAAKADKK